MDMGHKCAFWRVACLLAACSGHALATGNNGDFGSAGSSAVPYTRTVLSARATACPALALLPPGAFTILSADLFTAGDADLTFCRVTGNIPGAIRFVVEMPLRWNGRLYMHGNGGDAGEALDNPAYMNIRRNAMSQGFAAVFTNTGHDARTEPDTTWAFNQPEKETDYGYRAVHVTAAAAKALLQAFYGQQASFSYFDGCSTGGRQGLMSAQRFPEDFDGILAGAPVMQLTHMLWQYWKNQVAIEATPITPERLEQLAAFIAEHYDALDGVKDGVINDPLAVDFVPSRDLPRAATKPGGFTDAELITLDRIYGPVMAGTRDVYPRTVIGGEGRGQVYHDATFDLEGTQSAWVTRVVPDAQGNNFQKRIVEDWFRYVLFDTDDPERDWRRMEPARDMADTQKARALLDAVDPDLGAFHARGGRLILYHGWADFGVNPLRTLQYANQVSGAMGRDARDVLALYLVPGMFHCYGGVNVDHFDLMTPLINWVEKGIPPGTVTGSRVDAGRVMRTRPLCRYPQHSRYRGQGNTDAAASFICED